MMYLRQLIADIKNAEPIDIGARPMSAMSNEVVIRVGLNSGRLRAGVVGLDSPRYKLVGDTVNTASRMESTCIPGRVQVSMSTQERLTPGMFMLEDRGEIEVKGKGVMKTAFLKGYADGNSKEPRTVMIDIGQVLEPSPSGTRPQLGRCDSSTSSLCDMDSNPSPYQPSAHPHSDGEENHDSGKSERSYHLVSMALRSREFERVRSNLYHIENTPSDKDVGGSSRCSCQRFQLMFLLLPKSEKQPEWMATLRDDLPTFANETLHDRIAMSRTLTIVWQLLIGIVASVDFFMDVLEEDLPRYRQAILFRCFGNTISGLVYLLLLTSPGLFRKHAQVLTISMLAVQGFAILACGMTIYNSEVAVISMYGAYVLFYTVCTFFQRLMLCALAAVGYVVIEFVGCGSKGVVGAWNNIFFVIGFLLFNACGVRLDEHLAHVAHYEQRRVSKRLQVIKQAKAAGSQLLESLLPPHVVELVGQGVSPIAEHHSDVTIIFTDIKGFTNFSSKISPHELVDFLNSMYTAFDDIIVNWQLHKVEIIGDAYFVSAGCPSQQRRDQAPIRKEEYAMRAVEVALLLQRTLPTVCDDSSVSMRVGIHSGAVVAGVVGKKGPRYHLFGPAVGYAEKMESNGIPGRVQISDTTHQLLTAGRYDYTYEERSIEIDSQDPPHRTWLVNKGGSKQAHQIHKKLIMQRRKSCG
jgi:class 3 adenylate cyclase